MYISYYPPISLSLSLYQSIDLSVWKYKCKLLWWTLSFLMSAKNVYFFPPFPFLFKMLLIKSVTSRSVGHHPLSYLRKRMIFVCPFALLLLLITTVHEISDHWHAVFLLSCDGSCLFSRGFFRLVVNDPTIWQVVLLCIPRAAVRIGLKYVYVSWRNRCILDSILSYGISSGFYSKLRWSCFCSSSFQDEKNQNHWNIGEGDCHQLVPFSSPYKWSDIFYKLFQVYVCLYV